jgi:hypothetical protein
VGFIRVRTLSGAFTPEAGFVVSLSATAPAGSPAYTKGALTLR